MICSPDLSIDRTDRTDRPVQPSLSRSFQPFFFFPFPSSFARIGVNLVRCSFFGRMTSPPESQESQESKDRGRAEMIMVLLLVLPHIFFVAIVYAIVTYYRREQ